MNYLVFQHGNKICSVCEVAWQTSAGLCELCGNMKWILWDINGFHVL